MTLIQTGYARLPGIHEVLESLEMDPTWGRWEINRTWIFPAILATTTRDRYDPSGGASPTDQTILRPGLLMSYIISGGDTGKWKHWIDDGSQNVAGVLLWSETLSALTTGQTVEKWFGYILSGGQVKTKGTIVYGRAAAAPQNGTGYGNLVGYDESGQAPAGSTEAQIRTAMQTNLNFQFDDYTTAIGVAT